MYIENTLTFALPYCHNLKIEQKQHKSSKKM